jgi:hypothetical protein
MTRCKVYKTSASHFMKGKFMCGMHVLNVIPLRTQHALNVYDHDGIYAPPFPINTVFTTFPLSSSPSP